MSEIKINGKNYPIRVAVNTFRILGKKTGLELDEITSKLAAVQKNATTGKLKIADMEFFASFIQAAVEDALRKAGTTDNSPPDLDSIIDLFDSPTEIEKAFSELTESLPDPNTSQPVNPPVAE